MISELNIPAPTAAILALEAENQRLRAENTQLRGLLNSTPEIIFTLDRDQRYTGVFGRWLSNLGVTAEFFLGRTPREILGAEAATPHEAANAVALAGGTQRYGWNVPRPDGSTTYMETTVSPLLDSTGQVIGVVGVGRDVTQRHDDQAQLSLWELIFQVAGWGIILVDQETRRIAAVNPAARAMYGYSHEQMIGMESVTLFPPHARALLTEKIAIVDSRGHVQYEADQLRSNGEIFPASINVTLARGVQGNIRYRVINVKDISERRAAEIQRQVATERLAAIIHDSPLAMIVTDLNSIVQVWNPAAERLFGWRADEAVGHFLPYIGEEFLDEYRTIRAAELRGDVLSGHETTRRRRDGSLIHVRLYTALLRDAAQQVVSVMAIIEDVTAYKQVQMELEQTTMRLQLLHAVDRTALSAHTTSEIATNLLRVLRESIPCARAALLVMLPQSGDPSTGILYVDTDRPTHIDSGQTVMVSAAQIETLKHSMPQDLLLEEAVMRNPALPEIQTHAVSRPPHQQLYAEGLRRLLTMPLFEQGELIGILTLGRDDPAPFTAFEYDVIHATATNMAVALNQARLHEAVQRHAEELEQTSARLRMLHTLESAMLVAASTLDLATTILQELRRHFQCERVSIFHLTDLSASTGVFYVDSDVPTTIASGFVAKISPTEMAPYVHGEPVEYDLAAVTPDFPLLQRLYREGLRRHIALALYDHGEISGFLNLSRRDPRPFSPEEQRTLREAAPIIIIALKQAQLHEAVRHHAEEQEQIAARLQLLHTIDQAMLTERVMPTLARRILVAMRSFFACERVSFVQIVDFTTHAGVFYVESDVPTSMPSRLAITVTPEQMASFPEGQLIEYDTAHAPDSVPLIQRLAREGLLRYIGLGLYDHEQLIGFLGLSRRDPTPFSELERATLLDAGTVIAVALSHMRLNDAVRRHAEELETRVAERTAELEQANRQLREVARLKDEFLSNMSHELRTPLTGVLNLTEALVEGAYGPIAERQQRPLSLVMQSGQQLADLVNDLLDISRIEAGRFRMQMDPCNLNEVCESSLNQLRGLVNQKHQRLEFSCDPSPLLLIADGRRIKQMLVNLLSNAVKFTPEGGRISLRVQADAPAGVVRLAVIDTGIGIAPEDVDRLFQPFSQLDSSLSRQHAGTGLGLTLVKRIAQLHGGDVQVISQLGQGSTFTLVLPWQTVPSTPPPTSQAGNTP